MNDSVKKNKHYPFKEQDRERFVPLLFLPLLPLTALLPHAHLLCAILLAVTLGQYRWKQGTLLGKKVRLYCLFLCFSLSGVFISIAWRETLLTTVLRLSFFIPLLFPRIERRIPTLLALMGGVLGAVASVELLLGYGKTGYADTTRFSSLSRAAGPFGNPNILAAFLIPATLFALAHALHQRERRCLYLLAFLFSLGGICATFSRGGMLAVGVGILWLLFKKYGFFRTLMGGLLLFPAATFCIPSSLGARILSLTACDSSVLYRFSLWKSVARIPLPSLLFGVGEGKRALLSLLFPHLSAGLSHIEHTHSLFLHLLLSTGIIGFLLFLGIVFASLRTKETKGVRASILAFLLFGMFDDPLYAAQTEVIFWLTLGL